jgi:transposase
MNTTVSPQVHEHWVGLDVAKAGFDAALVRPGQRYPQTPMREIPFTSFQRTQEGVQALLTWLDELTDHSEEVRVVMECTGGYSIELAGWLLEARRSLQPAIHHAQDTAHFIKSLGLRNKTDGMDARALALFGAERRPAPYEPLSSEREELRRLSRYRDLLVGDRVALKNHLDESAGIKFVTENAKKKIAFARRRHTAVRRYHEGPRRSAP